MNFAIEFFWGWQNVEWLQKNNYLQEKKNMIVYHYCSLESLNSILKNRSLRLTNILKSNDSMEISWICRYYDAEFKRAYENASDLFRSKISSERLMGYVKLFTDEFFNETIVNDIAFGRLNETLSFPLVVHHMIPPNAQCKGILRQPEKGQHHVGFIFISRRKDQHQRGQVAGR